MTKPYTTRRFIFFVLCVLTPLIAACDPMAPRATPQSIIVTMTWTPTPSFTDTPVVTRTPAPTPTQDFTPTPTPFPCEEPGRIFDSGDNRSEIARENLPYDVYVPPCYRESSRRFPLVILLHGLGVRQTQWQDLGIVETLDQGIRLGVLPPMIVAMPYYANIGVRNTFPPDASYESVLLDELLPALQRDFCVYEDRDHRAIGGISRGGFWAYSLGLRFPDLFGSIGAHSGFFPDEGGEVPPAYNPIDIARNSTLLPTANLRLYLDNAARDDAGITQKTLADRLGARGIPYTYIINTVGEHDNAYWSAHLSEYLAFYGENWPKNYNSLPSCLEPSP